MIVDYNDDFRFMADPPETLGDLLRKRLDETESAKERFQRLGRQHGLACCCDACMKALQDYNSQNRQR